MIALIGKTCSGKNKIQSILCEKHGFKPLITYTTRPIRQGEINGVTYHYISEEEFISKINSGFFIEWRKYKTTSGTWYYGSAKKDCINADDKTIAILTPSGVIDIRHNGINIKCLYIYANNITIEKRLNSRGDERKEAIRRLMSDNKNFINAEKLADKIIYNNDKTNIYNVIDSIIFYLRKCDNNE